MATTTIEDFSFPTFTDTVSSAIDSPPLWRLSPAASPDSCHNKTTTTTKKQENQESDQEGDFQDEESDQEEDFKDCFPIHKPIKNSTQRKSFSWIEKVNNYDEDDDKDQEKMDMLWEDFNEELALKRSHSSSRISDSDMGCVQLHRSLRLSKTSNSTTNTAMVSAARKPAVAGSVVFMKVLKKLFSLHNSHSHKSVHNQNRHSHIRRRVKNR